MRYSQNTAWKFHRYSCEFASELKNLIRKCLNKILTHCSLSLSLHKIILMLAWLSISCVPSFHCLINVWRKCIMDPWVTSLTRAAVSNNCTPLLWCVFLAPFTLGWLLIRWLLRYVHFVIFSPTWRRHWLPVEGFFRPTFSFHRHWAVTILWLPHPHYYEDLYHSDPLPDSMSHGRVIV